LKTKLTAVQEFTINNLRALPGHTFYVHEYVPESTIEVLDSLCELGLLNYLPENGTIKGCYVLNPDRQELSE